MKMALFFRTLSAFWNLRRAWVSGVRYQASSRVFTPDTRHL